MKMISLSKRSSFIVVALIQIVQLLHVCDGYSMGAPDVACSDMVPRHGQKLQESTPPYTLSPNVTSINSGDRITLTLEATDEHIKGFFVQGRQEGEETPVGTFFTDQYKMRICGKGYNNAVTHTSPSQKNVVRLEWEAPSDFEGDVIFRGTVVKSYVTYWTNLRSPKVSVKKRSLPPSPKPDTDPQATKNMTTSATTIATTTTTTTTTTKSSEKSGLASLYEGCDKTKTCYGSPENCATKKSCSYMVSYTHAGNGRYEFELKAESGGNRYVAVGLSLDNKMGDDSVVMCTSKNGEMDTFMTYNEGRSNVNVLKPKEGLELVDARSEDGAIYCRFLMDEVTKPKNRVFDLKKEKYHVLLANGNMDQDGRLYHHGPNKIFSTRPVSLGVTSKLKQKDVGLYKMLHAVLMIGAWVGAASCGILFARYYKQTWLQYKCCAIDQWFHFHRFFMILTWCLTMAALVLIVYALEKFEPSNHSKIGLTSIILCFIQPFMAALRPHPDAKRRNIFNLAHWFVGNSAQILGICAIFFGFEEYLGSNPHWVKTIAWYTLIVFIAFHCAIHLLLSIAQCVSDRKPNNSEVYPLKDLAGSRTLLQPDDVRMDAPGGCFRKFVLSLYLPLNWMFTTLLILLVVFDREDMERQFTEWNFQPFWEDLV